MVCSPEVMGQTPPAVLQGQSGVGGRWWLVSRPGQAGIRHRAARSSATMAPYITARGAASSSAHSLQLLRRAGQHQPLQLVQRHASVRVTNVAASEGFRGDAREDSAAQEPGKGGQASAAGSARMRRGPSSSLPDACHQPQHPRQAPTLVPRPQAAAPPHTHLR